MSNTSWKMEVLVQGTWSSNACVYATKDEAEAAGVELLQRWFLPIASRAVENTTGKPVNYKFDFTAQRPVALNNDI